MLVVTSKLTCDGCRNEILVDPKMPRNDYLTLDVSASRNPTPSDFVYALLQLPLLPRPFHFHGRNCLALWMDGKGNQPE